MSKLNRYKLILSLAAMVFVGKTFAGLMLYRQFCAIKSETSAIARIFAERKPKFFAEADSLVSKTKRVAAKSPVGSIPLWAKLFSRFHFSRLHEAGLTQVADTGRLSMRTPRNRPLYLLNRELTI